MIEWLALTDTQRRTSLEQAQILSNIRPKAIEKDWWVTLVLKALFDLPCSEYFNFKGGTSLSKGWHLIERLSEDIDIALSLEAFGMEYRTDPSHSYVKKAKKEGCKYTSTIIKDLLEEKLNDYNLYGKTIRVYAQSVSSTHPDKDPQTIFVAYPSLYEPNDYFEDKVKIEFGVRSIKDPFESILIQSILSEVFPRPLYQEAPFTVPASLPHKTFIEKMCLMHEKLITKEILQKDVERQSRHLYDLIQMSDKGILEKVLGDRELYNIIIEHRKNWIRLKGIQYDTLQANNISFVPSDDLKSYFRDDYNTMREIFIYGNPPDFETLVARIQEINKLINKMK